MCEAQCFHSLKRNISQETVGNSVKRVRAHLFSSPSLKRRNSLKKLLGIRLSACRRSLCSSPSLEKKVLGIRLNALLLHVFSPPLSAYGRGEKGKKKRKPPAAIFGFLPVYLAPRGCRRRRQIMVITLGSQIGHLPRGWAHNPKGGN